MPKETLAMSLTDPMADARPRFTARPAAWAAMAAAALLLAGPASGAEPPVQVAEQDLTELSLQELLDVQVTSVSKHAEPLRRAAGAIAVVTGDDIRRAGARTIAEALRLVPGLQVYHTNAQTYTVTARGFNNDKLEVLLDGRSVYTPLTSAVFWDVLDTFLPDIDRIEVIRGPGATLWGANAVNGVVNIVTKHTWDTLGTLVRAGGGKEERAFGGFSTGAKIGDGAHGRLYAKAFERDSSHQRAGGDTFDGQRQGQAGFRTDWVPAEAHAVTVSGDFYKGVETTEDIRPSVYGRGPDTELTGANLVARWALRTSEDSEVSVQTYYDGYHRVIPGVFDEKRDTGDLQLQHRFHFGTNTVTYGAGYRGSRDDTGGPPNILIFSPQSRILRTYSAFGQLQHRFGEDGELTVGSKFEHDTYTGFEAQPGVRLGWAVGQHAFTWGAVSRAVRLPNRLDEDVAIFCVPPFDTVLGCAPGSTVRIGNPDFESEKLIAYEWGLRAWTTRNFSADLATFYNVYTGLRSTESTPPPIGSFGNKLEAKSYGAELALAWVPLDWLSVRPFYSYLHIDAEQGNSTDSITPRNLEKGSPGHSAGLHLGLAPLSNVTMDGFARYVGELERQQVPAYTELNVRVGWRPVPSLELALVGADLLDKSHPEAGSAPSRTTPNPAKPATEVERAVWLDLLWEWE